MSLMKFKLLCDIDCMNFFAQKMHFGTLLNHAREHGHKTFLCINLDKVGKDILKFT